MRTLNYVDKSRVSGTSLRCVSLCFILLSLIALPSCRSHKEVHKANALTVDSVAGTAMHRSWAVRDSAFRLSAFRFDTLDVVIERPACRKPAASSASDFCPGLTTGVNPREVIRLRAVNGRVTDSSRTLRDSAVTLVRLDSVTSHHSAQESDSRLSGSAHLFTPPNGTAVIAVIAVIIIVSLLLFALFKKR